MTYLSGAAEITPTPTPPTERNPPPRLVAVSYDCGRIGRGVRATSAISAGTEVEVCELIVVPAEQIPDLDRTVLYGYYYEWGGAGAVALDCGSLYNHSVHPNADYIKDFEAGVVRIVALRDVNPGEEIRIDYSRGGSNPLWFDSLAE
jgi:SET domain-containing protein